MATKKVSAGIVAWRQREELEVLIVHPGGPYFAGREEGAWSIPKGGVEGKDYSDASLRENALRELQEETGLVIEGELIFLGSVTQRAGKEVYAYAVHCENDPPYDHRPPQVSMEYPRGSSRILEFPEIDAAGFTPLRVARRKLNVAQVELLDRLLLYLETKRRDGRH